MNVQGLRNCDCTVTKPRSDFPRQVNLKIYGVDLSRGETS